MGLGNLQMIGTFKWTRIGSDEHVRIFDDETVNKFTKQLASVEGATCGTSKITHDGRRMSVDVSVTPNNGIFTIQARVGDAVQYILDFDPSESAVTRRMAMSFRRTASSSSHPSWLNRPLSIEDTTALFSEIVNNFGI